MNSPRDPLAPFRGRLLGLGYRMLGSRIDAEDVLQDAYVRFCGSTNIENVEAYLTTVVTRLCLDRLKSARAQREVYVGPWLPEPVLDDERLSPEAATEAADDLSFAFMLALERLTPAERAAFLLHDVFDLSFREIGVILERSDVACRQLAARARKAVRQGGPRDVASAEGHAQVFQAFLLALASGDLGELTRLLREDAVLLSDSGGMRPSAINPILGADRIARLLVGGAKKFGADLQVTRSELARINGCPSQIIFVGEAPNQTMSASISGGLIAALYIIRNPKKLARLVA